MANRIVEIKITGDGAQYEATMDRLIDKSNELNQQYEDMDLIKEVIAEMNVKDQQKIYEWLNIVCGCRMPY